ncbi:hypothetical protein THERMOT_1836 [Bathymodiolus thermophilus thioautotrophic gill symbiont]|nr:hypothetical protein THERMOT_1836 [Bathymodiolus thermophilus thioautotrophic gill symbiont]
MRSIKQHFFHLKIHQIAGYSPHFWLKNALFYNAPKSLEGVHKKKTHCFFILSR